MYCRYLNLPSDDECEFVFQAQRREQNTERYSATYSQYDLRNNTFPVRATVEEAVEDLKSKEMDGQVMRFVKTPKVAVGGTALPSFTAGCAARIWMDTSATDSDVNHFTKEQLEEKGRIVSELYLGPFSLKHCHQIIEELKDKISELRVIKLGSAYNVAQVIHIEHTSMVSIKDGKLHINATKENVEALIDDWHENHAGQGKALHDFLEMPFAAFGVYATSISKCSFLPSK